LSRSLKTGPFPIGGTLQKALNRHADMMHRDLKRMRTAVWWVDKTGRGRFLVGTKSFHRTKGGMLRRRLNRLHVPRVTATQIINLMEEMFRLAP